MWKGDVLTLVSEGLQIYVAVNDRVPSVKRLSDVSAIKFYLVWKTPSFS